MACKVERDSLEDTAATPSPADICDIALWNIDDDRADAITPDRRSAWQRVYRHRGILLVIIASFLAATQHMLTRFILEDMHVMQLSFLRFAFQLFSPIPILIFNNDSVTPGSFTELTMLLARGILGTVSIVSFFYALLFTRIGDATAVTFASPVFVGIGARIFLKEAFDVLDAILVAVVIGGVFLISQPPFLFGSIEEDEANASSRQLIGVSLAFVGSVLWAVNILIMRRLGQWHISALKIVFWYGVVAVFGTSVFTTMLSGWSMVLCYDVRYATVALGVLNFLTQAMFSYSLSLERSVFVSVLRTNEVVFSYILEFLFFGLSPGVWVILGVVLVMAASITASMKKMWISKQKGIARRRSLATTL